MSVAELREWSEIAKNLAAAIALLGGAWAVYVWVFQRRDRAADVLLMLEARFAEGKVAAGRGDVEDQSSYVTVKGALAAANAARHGGAPMAAQQSKQLENIDALLRFYVVLLGIRRARQVPDASLKTCYRYWLGLYYHKDRPELREYVDVHYRTLSRWLADDQRQPLSRRFFDPQPD